MATPIVELFDTPVTDESWDVPDNVWDVTIECAGASAEDGGRGHIVAGDLNVEDIDTLYLTVGDNIGDSHGNGGAASDGSDDGGGASWVIPDGTDLQDRVIVGGGGGGDGSGVDAGDGGDAGHPDGEDGTAGTGTGGGGGEGGTQTEGGDGGRSGDDADGEFGAGGSGGAGGGGSGWYGGGGGGTVSSGSSGGGGGGSSYTDGVADTDTDVGFVDGDSGYIELTYGIAVAAPENLTVADTTDTSVSLEWDDSDGEPDEYRIYRDTEPDIDPTQETPIDTVDETTTSYDDTGRPQGRTYYYVVTAWNDTSGETEPSNEVSATTDLPAPDQPTLTEVS